MASATSSAGYVSLRVSSSLGTSGFGNRYQTSLSIRQLKGKLELVTGATASLAELQLFNTEEILVCSLDNDDATLGSYPVGDGFRIHVVDHDASKVAGEFNDVSKVQKFEISKEAYSNRTDSVLAFKKRMKLAQFSEKDPEANRDAAARVEKEMAEAIALDSRCEVVLPGAMPKRGTVVFTGLTKFKSGYFVGVRYDEPLGKNDGSVEGVQYFECPPNYGTFVRPKYINVGDFPEETLSDDEM